MVDFNAIYTGHARAFQALARIDYEENIDLAVDLLHIHASTVETRAWIVAAPFLLLGPDKRPDLTNTTNRTTLGMAYNFANNPNASDPDYFPVDLYTKPLAERVLFLQIRQGVIREVPKLWNCLVGSFESVAKVGETLGQVGVLAAALKNVPITGFGAIAAAALTLGPMLTDSLRRIESEGFLPRTVVERVLPELVDVRSRLNDPKQFKIMLSLLTSEAQTEIIVDALSKNNTTQQDCENAINARIDELSSILEGISQRQEILKDHTQQLQHAARREELAQWIHDAKEVHDLAQAVFRVSTLVLGHIPGSNPEQAKRIETVCSNVATVIFAACTMQWMQITTTVINSICNIGEVFAATPPNAAQLAYLERIHDTVTHIAENVGVIRANTFQILDLLRLLTGDIRANFAHVSQQISQMGVELKNDAHHLLRDNYYTEFSERVLDFEAQLSGGIDHHHPYLRTLLTFFYNYGIATADLSLFSGKPQPGQHPSTIGLLDRMTQVNRLDLNFGLLHVMVLRVNSHLDNLRAHLAPVSSSSSSYAPPVVSGIPDNIDMTSFVTPLPNPIEWARATMVFTGFWEIIRDAGNPIFLEWVRVLTSIGRQINHATETLSSISALRAGRHAYLSSAGELSTAFSQTILIWDELELALERLLTEHVRATGITSLSNGFPRPTINHLGKFTHTPLPPGQWYQHIRAAVNTARADSASALRQFYWIDKVGKSSPNIDLFSTSELTSSLNLAIRLGIIELSALPCETYHAPGSPDPHRQILTFSWGYLAGLQILNQYYYTDQSPTRLVNMFCCYEGNHSTSWRDAVMQRNIELQLPPFIDVNRDNSGNDYLSNLNFMDFIYLYVNAYLEFSKASLINEGWMTIRMVDVESRSISNEVVPVDLFENLLERLNTHASNDLEICLNVLSHFQKFGQKLSTLFDNLYLPSSSVLQSWKEFKKAEIKGIIKSSMQSLHLFSYNYHMNAAGYYHITVSRITNHVLADQILPEIRSKLSTFFESYVDKYCAEIHATREGVEEPRQIPEEERRPGSSESPIRPEPTIPHPPRRLPAIAFGKEMWARYFGDVGEEPLLPPNIEEILGTRCPFWPEKTIGETHLLTLIPGKVNGRDLTLDYLGELIQKPKNGGHATKYRYYWDSIRKQEGSKSLVRSHWVLMTRDVLPGTRCEKYTEQKSLLEKQVVGMKLMRGGVPTLIEAGVTVLMEHVRTGRRLYGDNPLTFTCCEEVVKDYSYQSSVGGFSADGLHLSTNDVRGTGRVGVSCSWKFLLEKAPIKIGME